MSRWPTLLAVGLGAIMLVLVLVNLSRVWTFSPGEELNGGGVESVVVSGEESPYLPTDVERFGRRPGAVYVYVVVRELPPEERLEARVEHESAASVLSGLFSGGEGGVMLEPLQTRPGPGRNLDVVRFALRGRSGGAVPPGNYTVGVYREGGEDRVAEPAARKFFQIRG